MFYTYAHQKPNGPIFYIGKGSEKRANATDNRNKHWHNVVNKHGREVKLLAKWDTEEDALSHERLLIACFRDMGIKLVNVTSGGEGVSGLKHSEATRKKLSAFQKQFQNTEKMRAVHQKIGALTKLPERRAAHSEKIRILMQDPVARERSRLGALKQTSDPAFIAAQRERALKRMQDAKFRYLMAQPCICVETGQVFQSQAGAAKFVGGRPQTICRAVSGKRKTAYGYHWAQAPKE